MNLSEGIIVTCFIFMAYYYGKYTEKRFQMIYIKQLRKFIGILQEKLNKEK